MYSKHRKRAPYGSWYYNATSLVVATRRIINVYIRQRRHSRPCFARVPVNESSSVIPLANVISHMEIYAKAVLHALCFRLSSFPFRFEHNLNV